MNMNKLLDRCPSCGGSLIITECQCPNCALQVRGKFAPSRYSILSDDQIFFIQVFLKVRGNLSEAERVLGVSYPTIRNKLEEINSLLEQLNTNPVPAKPSQAADNASEAPLDPRRELLRRVAEGSISAQAADQQLHKLEAGQE
jgi:hypothetical protein